MKIVVAPNDLKDSLTSEEAAMAIVQGIKDSAPDFETTIIPITDGDEGTIETIWRYTRCDLKTALVRNPLGEKIEAKWLLAEENGENLAIIEASEAIGKGLVDPSDYNPFATTSYGVGELIDAALNENCKKIILTLGESITCDAGVGMVQALGGSFTDAYVAELPLEGGSLNNLMSIDLSKLDERIAETTFIIATDLEMPLCGIDGFIYTYGEEIGASKDDIKILDDNLLHLSDRVKASLGLDFENEKGAGAAGGLAYGLMTFLNAERISVFDLLAELSFLEKNLDETNLVITTEGRLDRWSFNPENPTYRLAQLCKKKGVPIIVLAGSIEEDLDLERYGFTSAFSITDSTISLTQAIENAYDLLEDTASRVAMTLKISRQLG